jgi:hypothetical protein
MRHLNLETLARLVDEPAAPGEAAHLAACTECRDELEALRLQTRVFGEMPEIEPPAGAWEDLEVRLASEGLVRPAPRIRWFDQAGLRVAAGLLLFVLGGISGAALRGGDAAPALAVNESAALPVAPVNASQELRQAEAAYRAALARHAEVAGVPETINPAARLATLETIVLTTQEALRQAPADPVINGYHLAAVSQRDATLRQYARSADEQPWF